MMIVSPSVRGANPSGFDGGRLPQAGTAQVGIEPAGRSQSQHAEIAGQRSQRVAERFGAIVLDADMRGPSETVANHRRRDQEPPVPHC
jgi:hypothetical protein